MSLHGSSTSFVLAGVLSSLLLFGEAEGDAEPAGGEAQAGGAAQGGGGAQKGGEARKSGGAQAGAEAQPGAPPGEDQARAALKDMSTALASAKTLRFKVHGLRPMQLSGGEWITLVGGASVMRSGKDKVFIETSGDLFPFRFYFDGKTVTAFAPKENVYAQKEAAGTIDDALARAAKNGEATFVFADLLSSDPYAAMTAGLKRAAVVGTSTIDGEETRHLAVHGRMMDWEIWIGTKDRLPRMVTLTDIGDARKPTQAIMFSDWEIDGALPADAFSFNAPSDATRVPFANPRQWAAGRRGSQAKRPGSGGAP